MNSNIQEKLGETATTERGKENEKEKDNSTTTVSLPIATQPSAAKYFEKSQEIPSMTKVATLPERILATATTPHGEDDTSGGAGTVGNPKERTAASSGVIGAHSVAGVGQSNGNVTGLNGDEEEPMHDGGGGCGDLECQSGTANDEWSQNNDEGVLVTAAEVFEETSEQLRQKQTLIEEEILQRISVEAVEAHPVSQDEQSPISPATKGDIPSSRRQRMLIVCLLAGLLVSIAVAVALGVGMTSDNENDEKEDSSNDLITPTPTVLPSPSPTMAPTTPAPTRLGDNWPPQDAVIAHVPETICLERMPRFGVTRLCTNTSQELGSGVVNLIAQSRLWNIPQADMSILNAAEVRTDIPAGNFTVAMGQALMPFNNTLVVMQIEGSKLVAAMERALQKIVDDYSLIQDGRVSGASYPYGAGIRWNVNMSEGFPRRLYNIQVQEHHPYSSALVVRTTTTTTTTSPRSDDHDDGGDKDGWVPLNDTKVYSVLTNSWLAEGGDGYNEFHRLDRALVYDTGVDSLTAFSDYCQHHPVLRDPPSELYSTQSYNNKLYNWTWTWE